MPIPTFYLSEVLELPADGQAGVLAALNAGQARLLDDTKGPKRRKRHPAATDFTAFCELTTPWKMDPWQRIICERLQKLKDQTGQRLLVHGPPQMGKSILISQRLPCWILGNSPTYRMRVACYNEKHATRFSRTNLNIMRTREFREVFPDPDCRVPPMSAGFEWSTVARAKLLDSNPSMKALGMNSGFVGLGVDLLVIDDPYKSRAEAFSELINEGVWNWMQGDVTSRLNPQTNVVVMFHRWKQDDLAGRLIEQGGWELMRFPALYDGGPGDDTIREMGESLCEDRYPAAFLREKQRTMGEEMFLALYQGSPVAEGGNHFSVRRIGNHDIHPRSPDMPLLRTYQGWDLALSTKKKGDYVVGATIGVDGDQNIYILDIRRERLDFNETMEAMAEEYLEWSPALWPQGIQERGFGSQKVRSVGIETTAYQLSAFQEASRRYMAPFTEVKPSKDKVSRSQLLADRMKMGKVFANQDAEWWPELEKELLAFPNGQHDDCVDAITEALELHPLGLTAKSEQPPPEMSAEGQRYVRDRVRKSRRRPI